MVLASFKLQSHILPPQQCCIVAFLLLTESKLKNWTVKYGREERVQHLMHQYRTFVSKNKIFQEFHKAYVEFKEVCGEYKRDGQIGKQRSGYWDRVIQTDLSCVGIFHDEGLGKQISVGHRLVDKILILQPQPLQKFKPASFWITL